MVTHKVVGLRAAPTGAFLTCARSPFARAYSPGFPDPLTRSSPMSDLSFLDDADDLFSTSRFTLPARQDWESIRRCMRDLGVHGNHAVVDYLALVGSPTYRAAGPRVRALISAPPSAGKTFLLESFARAAKLPFLQVDASAITPEGWSGVGVSDLMSAAYLRAGRDLDVMQRGLVLVLDEMDKAVRRTEEDRYGSSVRQDRQSAMLQLLWGGTPIRFSSNPAAREQFDLESRTDRWIIVACGAFAGSTIATEPPTDEALIDWGFTPEVASRLITRLVMPARSATELATIIRDGGDGIDPIAQVCADYGHPLTVTEGALHRVADAVATARGGLTLRVGTQLLIDAANRALIQALTDSVPRGTPLVVAPDDIDLPSMTRTAL